MQQQICAIVDLDASVGREVSSDQDGELVRDCPFVCLPGGHVSRLRQVGVTTIASAALTGAPCFG